MTDYKSKFLQEMNRLYEGQLLNSVEHFIGEKIKTVSNQSDIGYLMKIYGTKDTVNMNELRICAEDITLPNYSSVYRGIHQQEATSFESTLNFYQDLFIASQEISNADNRK